MNKTILVTGFIGLIVVLMVLPALLVSYEGRKEKVVKKPEPVIEATLGGESVSVFRASTETLEHPALEDYVVGVVANEMPASFELEALKAQALAARTYVVKAMGTRSNQTVKDTVEDQVYKNKDELKKIWGKDYDWKLAKVQQAVKATAGEILVYQGKPISALFFSTSNGRTENSEDYWSNKLPYLRSVDSHWDLDSPKLNGSLKISVVTFEKKLNVKLSDRTVGAVESRTTGDRIATVRVAGKTFTGREIREKLGLRSSDFSWKRVGEQIVITTKGYGHGVGMSQYGANGMANEGKSYVEILKHYYTGVEIVQDTDHLPSLVVSGRP